MNANKIRGVLSSHFQETILDKALFIAHGNVGDLMKAIKLMTPNRCSLNLWRAFLLQKQQLIESSEDEFSRIVRLR